jgi:DNA-binding transcriptional regulator YiaG
VHAPPRRRRQRRVDDHHRLASRHVGAVARARRGLALPVVPARVRVVPAALGAAAPRGIVRRADSTPGSPREETTAMRTSTRHHVIPTVLALALTACIVGTRATPPAAPVASAATPTAATAAPNDTAARRRDSLATAVLRAIAGREQEPAESVFKNLKLPGLRRVPARQLVAMMQLGYARSLGVSCEHCHVVGEWDSDDKRPKGTARDMIRMTNQLNTEILPRVSGLGDRAPAERPIVNCTTCHRGAVKPALNLPPAPPPTR